MAVKHYKKQDDVSYTLGITLTIELLKHRAEEAVAVYYHSAFERNDTFLMIEELCRARNIPFTENDKAFRILSDKENCFVIGEFRKYQHDIQKDQTHLVLVNPSNAGNMGTIIRTAIGFGVDNLAIIRPAADIFDPKTVRATMGSLFHLRFTYYDSFEKYLRDVSKRPIYPFMLKGSTSLSTVAITGTYSLVFGNEATGLPDEFMNYGQAIRIMHTDKIDSLNLPIAVSIALYQVTAPNFRH